MYAALKTRLRDELQVYRQAQDQYRSQIRTKVKRLVLIAKPDATSDEIDDIVNGGLESWYEREIRYVVMHGASPVLWFCPFEF